MNELFDDAPPKQRFEIGVETGQVMTVLGPFRSKKWALR